MTVCNDGRRRFASASPSWLPLWVVLVGVATSSLWCGCEAFSVAKRSGWRHGSSTLLRSASQEDPAVSPVVNVVLFGVGDLRVDDHAGLQKALANQSDKPNHVVVPLCILDQTSLSCLPGAVAHTADTAACLHHALADLSEELKQATGEPLQIAKSGNDKKNLVDTLMEVCQSYASDKVRVHVCDLGPADNDIGYGPYGQLCDSYSKLLRDNIKLVPWTPDLRSEPWNSVDVLPRDYTQYEKMFVTNQDALPPLDAPSATLSGTSLKMPASLTTEVPTTEELEQRLTQILSQRNPLVAQPGRVAAEKASGLYMTHWGGLSAQTVGCRTASKIAQAYAVECQQDDEQWVQHALYPPSSHQFRRNGRSLEHAAMNWQLKGKGQQPAGTVDNWMAGEAMTRFLTAPLFLGTVSPRRLWQLSREAKPALSLFMPPLERLVEAREWHRLLAAHNLAVDPAYQTTDDDDSSDSTISYRYWRYQGFLCRYAVTPMSSKTSDRNGVLLVHGFGASGTQWNKAMTELSQQQQQLVQAGQEDGTEKVLLDQGLALDLLGFGEAEKPAISYTGYLWDAQVSDFVKERAIAVHGWKSFVVGGNSIGGFTSMSVAACDTAGNKAVTSTGAPGTGMCQGLVLMNSAGPVKTAAEIEEERELAQQVLAKDPKNKLPLYSIAQVTATDALPPCQPPWRPVARGFGNALLLYLRPRIQSICVNLYPTNPDAVDDALCDAIERDSLDPGAVNVMMAGAKLPVPRTANELLNANHKMGLTTSGADGSSASVVSESTFDGPVLIAQGVQDPLNDAQDRLERFGGLRAGITMDAIAAGHCPHDEQPGLVAASILQWMRDNAAAETTSRSQAPTAAASTTS